MTNNTNTPEKKKGKHQGRKTGSYSCSKVKMSKLIERLKPDDEVPVNIRWLRLIGIAEEALQATTDNIKSLVEKDEPEKPKQEELINSVNKVETTDFTEKPIAA